MPKVEHTVMNTQVTTSTAQAVTAAVETPLRRFVRTFFEDRVAVVGLAMLLAIITLAVLAPFITPQNPYDLASVDLMDSRLPPGEQTMDGYTAWLGTDGVGRDLYSGILYGLRISLTVGVLSGVIAATLGMSIGLIAAYAGGRVETVVMRVVDLQLSLPAILIALILVAALGKGVDKIIIALIVVLTVQTAHAISLEATLSFLGVGLPQTEPSLGVLISNGFQYMMSGRYWISFFPGLALLLTIVSINLVGDRIRDVLNPRLEK